MKRNDDQRILSRYFCTVIFNTDFDVISPEFRNRDRISRIIGSRPGNEEIREPRDGNFIPSNISFNIARVESFFFFFFFREPHVEKKHTSTISLQFNCCGIHGYGDYNGTAWWRDAQISGNRRQVPLTCCVLKNTEVWGIYFYQSSNRFTIF